MSIQQLMLSYGGLHPSTIAYINAMTSQPSSAHVSNIDKLVKSLWSSGIWERMEYMVLFNQETEQASLINLIDPTRIMIETATPPTYTANVGFTNVASRYIKTPDNMSDWTNFAQTDNHIGIWALSSTGGNTQDCSEYANGTYLADMNSYYSGGSKGFCARNFGSSSSAQKYSGLTDVTTSIGHSLMNRVTSADFDIYKNGIKLTGGNTSTAIPVSRAVPSVPYIVLQGYNTASLRQYRLWHAGLSLTGPQISELYDSLTDYASGV